MVSWDFFSDKILKFPGLSLCSYFHCSINNWSAISYVCQPAIVWEAGCVLLNKIDMVPSFVEFLDCKCFDKYMLHFSNSWYSAEQLKSSDREKKVEFHYTPWAMFKYDFAFDLHSPIIN